jgi:hypothetical protein
VVPTENNLAEPWRRQPWEGDREWALFSEYLLECPGGRNTVLERLATRLGVASSYLLQLRHDHAWEVRALAWTRHLDDLRSKTVERVVEETAAARAKRHMGPLQSMLRTVAREMAKLERLANQAEGPGILTPKDITRMAEVAIKLERLCAGDIDPGARSEISLGQFTLDELRAMHELQRKAG